MRAGQGDRQLDLPQGGRGAVPAPGPPRAQVRRCGCRHGLRRGRSGRLARAPQADLLPGLPPAHRGGRLPRRGHHLRPQRLRRRHGHRGARLLRARLHRGDALDQGEPPGRQGLGRHLQRLVQLPRQQPGARGDPRRLPLPRHRAPASTWASSTPAPWPSTTRSTPSCASASRTSCSTADPTPPSGSSRSRRSTTRSVRPPRSARRSGAPCRSASASRTPSSRASTRTSRRTPSCSAPRSPSAAAARSRSSRARSWTA